MSLVVKNKSKKEVEQEIEEFFSEVDLKNRKYFLLKFVLI